MYMIHVDVCVQEEWVICRIFHKETTEKKVPEQLQKQSDFLEKATLFSLPPLLESPAAENPANSHQFQLHNEETEAHNKLINLPLDNPTPTVPKSLLVTAIPPTESTLTTQEGRHGVGGCKIEMEGSPAFAWQQDDHPYLSSWVCRNQLGAHATLDLGAADAFQQLTASMSYSRSFQMDEADDYSARNEHDAAILGALWTF